MEVNLITLKAGGVIEVWIEFYKSLHYFCILQLRHVSSTQNNVHNYNSRHIFAMQILLIS